MNVDRAGLPRPGAPTKNCDAGAYEYQLTGYDLVGSDGGVFVFNPPGVHTKGFYGSLPGIHVVPNKPVVGIVPTVTDQGYFLVAADGGVFAFGNAPFLGSLPGIKVTPNLPIVGIVAADTDKGYFLVGQDGGVYAFGTVPFLGSLAGQGHLGLQRHRHRRHPVGQRLLGGAGHRQGHTPSGRPRPSPPPPPHRRSPPSPGPPQAGGYWLVTQEGGVYPYGNAHKEGTGTLPAIHVDAQPPGHRHRAGRRRDSGLLADRRGRRRLRLRHSPLRGFAPRQHLHVSVTDIVGAVPN